DKRLLVASHIKPWKVSTNEERLDGHNGLLLSPHIDKLFDQGWISFSDEGQFLISSRAIESTLKKWHIDTSISVGPFTKRQQQYLSYHRTNVFKP
ncbi:MAG: HNH endonuclease, partial [Bacteroidetes bacterium]|nr:HNH endonuclease [Bacteroidota bacterium]